MQIDNAESIDIMALTGLNLNKSNECRSNTINSGKQDAVLMSCSAVWGNKRNIRPRYQINRLCN